MRKIDKNYCVATAYEVWIAKKQQELEDKGKKIPNYNTNEQYYAKDVFIALLYCQNGLCAYTEKRLIEMAKLQELLQLFNENGHYEGKRPACDADVEHFDSRKKAINGWEWDNFFVVYDSVNQKWKREKEKKWGIDSILKPDIDTYNPYLLLAYDEKHHLFFANEDENDQETCERIEKMIIVLGLNYDPIVRERKEYLKPIMLAIENGEEVQVDRFITACEMLKREYNKNL